MDNLLTFTWFFVGLCSSWGLLWLIKRSRITTRADMVTILLLSTLGPIISCVLAVICVVILMFGFDWVDKPIEQLSVKEKK